MRFVYQYRPEHVPYMTEQIWECRDDLGVYSRVSEYEHEQIRDHIGRPRVVMDLGCGLGRGAIHLNAVLGDPTIHFVLADTTGDTPNVGGWDLGEFYNDLALTASFAELNGLTNFETFDTRADDWSRLPAIDLVVSRCSFGMHVPIERVMPRLLAVTAPDCTMIFGTRRRSAYNRDSFRHLFHETLFLAQDHRPPFPQQDWLILKRKK